jgi:hypothetical protein
MGFFILGSKLIHSLIVAVVEESLQLELLGGASGGETSTTKAIQTSRSKLKQPNKMSD